MALPSEADHGVRRWERSKTMTDRPDDSRTAERSEDGRRAATAGLPAGRLVLGALLVLIGVLWLLDAAGVADLRWQVLLPAALTVVGLALMATARGPTHGGLVTMAVVLTVLVVASATIPAVSPLAGVGDRVERPSTAVEAAAGYELAMGTLTLDLRGLDPADAGDVSASVGMGELDVLLPEGAGADVRARAGAGEVVILGASRGGVGVSVDEVVPGHGSLALDLSVGMGTVQVRR